MKGCVQWTPVYDLKRFLPIAGLQTETARFVGFFQWKNLIKLL